MRPAIVPDDTDHFVCLFEDWDIRFNIANLVTQSVVGVCRHVEVLQVIHFRQVVSSNIGDPVIVINGKLLVPGSLHRADCLFDVDLGSAIRVGVVVSALVASILAR